MGRNIIVNIGAQRFDRMREQKAFYIDKTDFIREWWQNGVDVTLITRPRRFGKTLNMSMLECFFSNRYEGRSDLFEGLSIWKEESYRQLQGTFPVIFLSFANIKAKEYEKMKNKITEVIAQLYEQNRYLLDSGLLSENEKEYYNNVKVGMGDEMAEGAVHSMANFMRRYYDKDVIIILDEYDTPMQELMSFAGQKTLLSGYWNEAVTFFRGFFNSTFKTNPYLKRGLITGITRISKESIFSDLNNLKVITTTSSQYATAFGFTEEEVFRALDDTGLGEEKQGVKEWYDGFTFGAYSDIYNPWSIASFIDNNGEYDTYWADTSGNELVNSLIRQGNITVKSAMEDLLAGRTLTTELNEQIVFNQLDGSTGAVWSLLLATGYLKVVKLERVGERKKKVYTLALTNMEVASMFEDMVKGWFDGNTETAYNNFIKALLINDVDAMNEFMNKIALHSFSSFDIAKNASDDDAPERFYHGFVLGLMVELDGRFEITSNRESGFGRYDVMLIPKDREKDCAYIIEFKVHKPMKEKDLAETVANALEQIEEKRYRAKLVAMGFAQENIRQYGFAFRGKECLIG
ncbi:MAG: AAA family ATPase [Lachnospiraceae bacterium]|nr:AAA family ATPase [Lachnospiraceae bacterium]